MAKTSDWLPAKRQEQLTMAQNWVAVLRESSEKKSSTLADTWSLPSTVFNGLVEQTNAASSALAAAQNEETRTPYTVAQCRFAFKSLAALMRDIKKRWFFMPPLTEADFVRLGLKPRDTSRTISGTPTGQANVETYLVGRHQLGVKITLLTGETHDPANKGYRIWYSVTEQGETPPVSPEELRKSFFTKRKKDIIDFEFNDSGKIAWFAAQIENGDKKGPWGVMVSAVIP